MKEIYVNPFYYIFLCILSTSVKLLPHKFSTFLLDISRIFTSTFQYVALGITILYSFHINRELSEKIELISNSKTTQNPPSYNNATQITKMQKKSTGMQTATKMNHAKRRQNKSTFGVQTEKMKPIKRNQILSLQRQSSFSKCVSTQVDLPYLNGEISESDPNAIEPEVISDSDSDAEEGNESTRGKDLWRKVRRYFITRNAINNNFERLYTNAKSKTVQEAEGEADMAVAKGKDDHVDWEEYTRRNSFRRGVMINGEFPVLGPKPMTFEEAKRFCDGVGAKLPVPKNREDMKRLLEMAKSVGIPSTWLGIIKKDGKAKTKEVMNVYTGKILKWENWYRGQPNDPGFGIIIGFNTLKWFDRMNEDKHHFFFIQEVRSRKETSKDELKKKETNNEHSKNESWLNRDRIKKPDSRDMLKGDTLKPKIKSSRAQFDEASSSNLKNNKPIIHSSKVVSDTDNTNDLAGAISETSIENLIGAASDLIVKIKSRTKLGNDILPEKFHQEQLPKSRVRTEKLASEPEVDEVYDTKEGLPPKYIKNNKIEIAKKLNVTPNKFKRHHEVDTLSECSSIETEGTPFVRNNSVYKQKGEPKMRKSLDMASELHRKLKKERDQLVKIRDHQAYLKKHNDRVINRAVDQLDSVKYSIRDRINDMRSQFRRNESQMSNLSSHPLHLSSA